MKDKMQKRVQVEKLYFTKIPQKEIADESLLEDLAPPELFRVIKSTSLKLHQGKSNADQSSTTEDKLLLLNHSSLAEIGLHEEIDLLGEHFIQVNNLSELVLFIIRQNQLLNETLTWGSFLSTEDQIQALQLSLLQYEKKRRATSSPTTGTSDFGISLQNLFRTILKSRRDTNITEKGLTFSEKQILREYEGFIGHCGFLDFQSLEALLKGILSTSIDHEMDGKNCLNLVPFLVIGGKRSQETEIGILKSLTGLVSEIIEVKCTEDKVIEEFVTKEEFLSLLDCTFDTAEIVEDPATEQTQTILSPFSTASLQLRRIIFSYLQLIVNSKDEIALARAINMPDREIGSISFTALRKASQTKRMSMFQGMTGETESIKSVMLKAEMDLGTEEEKLKDVHQTNTAVSFSLQLKLGGKSYAPEKDDPLLECAKGISDFVDLIHDLQSITEENQDVRVSFSKILKSLKKVFLRADKRPFDGKTICRVFEEISNIFDKLARELSVFAFPESAVVNLKTLFSIQWMLDKYASAHVNNNICLDDDVMASVLKTPETSASLLKISSLASAFRTPEEGVSETPKRSAKKNLRDTPARAIPDHHSSARHLIENDVPKCTVKNISPRKYTSESCKGDTSSKVLQFNDKLSTSEKTLELSESQKENVPCAQDPDLVKKGREKKEVVTIDQTSCRIKKGKRPADTDNAGKSKSQFQKTAKMRRKEQALPMGQKKLTMFFKQT